MTLPAPAAPVAAPATPPVAAPATPPVSAPVVASATPKEQPTRTRSATSDTRPGSAGLLAVLASVAGLLAVIGSFVPLVNAGAWLLGVAAVALGVLVLARHRRGRAFAAAGIVTGGLALFVSAVMLLVFATGLLGQGGGGAGVSDGQTSSTAPDAASGDVIPARFGQTVTYDDGLQVQVSAPRAYSPSAEASGVEGAAAILVTITIYNGTSDPFQPASSSRVTAGGQDATPVADPSNTALGTPPSAAVPPGEAVSWQEAYSVASGTDAVPADLAYEIEPTSDYVAARFMN